MVERARALTLLLGFLCITGEVATASEQAAEETELACSECHVDPESNRLTDRGLYFEYLRTLAGYEDVVERFGNCVYCHVSEAGSSEFTKDGHRFRWMMEDMEGLRAWLAETHPKPADAETTEESDNQKEDR